MPTQKIDSSSSTRRTIAGIALRPGDEIRIEGTPDGGELAAQVDHAAGLEIAAELEHHLRQIGDDARAIFSYGGQNEMASHGAPIVDQQEMKTLSDFEVPTLCETGRRRVSFRLKGPSPFMGGD